MSRTPPFWVLQRQVKVEPLGDLGLRLTAPNLPAYELAVRPGEGGATGLLYRAGTGEGEKVLVAESDVLPGEDQAWEAAFELYRQHVIV